MLRLTLRIGSEKFFNSPYGKIVFVFIESKTRNVMTAINDMIKRDPHSACVANAVKSSRHYLRGYRH